MSGTAANAGLDYARMLNFIKGGDWFNAFVHHINGATQSSPEFPGRRVFQVREVGQVGQRVEVQDIRAYLFEPAFEGLNLDALKVETALKLADNEHAASRARAAIYECLAEVTRQDGEAVWRNEIARREVARATPMAKVGRPENGKGAVGTITKRGSNSADYLRRRLKRDRPDLLEKVADGRLSVRAAAVQAGIVKEPTPIEKAMAAFRRLTVAERRAFLEVVQAES